MSNLHRRQEKRRSSVMQFIIYAFLSKEHHLMRHSYTIKVPYLHYNGFNTVTGKGDRCLVIVSLLRVVVDNSIRLQSLFCRQPRPFQSVLVDCTSQKKM